MAGLLLAFGGVIPVFAPVIALEELDGTGTGFTGPAVDFQVMGPGPVGEFFVFQDTIGPGRLFQQVIEFPGRFVQGFGILVREREFHGTFHLT